MKTWGTTASRRVHAIVTAIAVAAVWPRGEVRAADEPSATKAAPLEGAVVKLDAADVFVDLGTNKGIAVGDVLELWRPITVKHPVTGKLLKDRFRIGSLRVVQAGPILSLTKPDGPVLRAVEPGDVVLRPGALVVAAPTTSSTTASTKTSPKTSASTAATIVVTEEAPDPDEEALSALFESLQGTDPATRVERYRAWAQAHPKSRFTPVLIEEARALAALDGAAPTIATTTAATTEPPTPPAIQPLNFHAPDEISTGAPVVFSIELAGPAVGAVLQVRGPDDAGYVPLQMHPDGPGYWSATIPVDRVRTPAILWFIEAVDAKGNVQPIEGSAESPQSTRVIGPPRPEAPKSWESTFSIWTDFADYNRLRGNDYAWQTEGWFGMRFGDLGLRAIRSGFGVYKGKGGGLQDLDVNGVAARNIGLSYGYLEAEWGILSSFSILTRAVIGLGEDGVTGGAQGFIRIGNDKKTNLLIGGEFLDGVGLRGITQVELAVFPRFPILLRTEVTNQPAGTVPTGKHLDDVIAAGESTDTGDLGVRAIAQVGWRVTPDLTIFVRGSYQGRTINHAGPGGGAGVMVSW